MSNWYFVENGQKHGPVTVAAIRQLRIDGRASDTTLVWTEGMGNWTPYGQIPALSLSAPPPFQAGTALGPEAFTNAAGQGLRPGNAARIRWYFEPFKKYATFSGRARRKEYWQFVLFNLLVVILLSILDAAVTNSNNDGGVFVGLYELAVFLPNLSVSVRRMHDTNHSGWWLLVPIYSLVLAVREGDPVPNQYGSNPKFPLP